jgi:hypothetical protein
MREHLVPRSAAGRTQPLARALKRISLVSKISISHLSGDLIGTALFLIKFNIRRNPFLTTFLLQLDKRRIEGVN